MGYFCVQLLHVHSHGVVLKRSLFRHGVQRLCLFALFSRPLCCSNVRQNGGMTRDWARLGEELRAARTERGIEQQDVAESIGVKRGALHNIERGAIARVTPTVIAYARLVGWADESVDSVLKGGEPVYRAPEPAAAPAPVPADPVPADPAPVDPAPVGPAPVDPAPAGPAPSDLSVLVQQSLREGPLLDARVTEVTTPGGKVRATIVIRGEDGLAPEDLLAALRSLRIDVTTED